MSFCASRLFGYTSEELNLLVAPMARTGGEALGSMGTDTPIAVLSERPRMLFDYFSQLFAQVTNPPLDAIREEIVTSLGATIGPEGDLLHPSADSCRQIALRTRSSQRRSGEAVHVNNDGEFRRLPQCRSSVASTPSPAAATASVVRSTACERQVSRGNRGRRDHRRALGSRLQRGSRTDPVAAADRGRAPPPGREKTRTKVGLVVEAGDAREVHHMALLIGYGAAAINPYLAFETIDDMFARGDNADVDPRQGASPTTSRPPARAS